MTPGKNIVICSDGTGNTDIKGRGTNVFKLFEALDLNGHRTNPWLRPQVALYDDGVGTETFRPVKVFTGMTGYGLSRNVRQLYKELVRVYDPEDRIFLFGFSRGAFTVRTLAGLIATCGIVDAGQCRTADALEAAVGRAYRAYRRRYRTALVKAVLGPPAPRAIERFKREHCRPEPLSIAFLGVWDTVDAVGLPFHVSELVNLAIYRFKFPDRRLSPVVERACHALALDDERHAFHPLLWQHGQGDDARIEQVWFAGAHSNVGGGYPKQGMSLVALDWMLHEAEDAGLRVLDWDREFYRRHTNVDDKLYDPRAGLGMFYRWKPRDMTALCEANTVRPAVHLSVLERVAHGTEDYAPGNLAPGATVVITPTGDLRQDTAALARARGVERVLHQAHALGKTPLLSRVRTSMRVGLASYYVYLLACLGSVVAASAPAEGMPVTTPWILALLAGGFLAAYVLAWLADRRMSAVFSEFWYQQQPKLRAALKAARGGDGPPARPAV